MGELFFGAALFGGFCLLLGVVYPICALLIYPIYRLLGGRKTLREYIRML